MNTIDMGLTAAARASQVATSGTPQRYTKALQLAESVSKRLAWLARRDVLLTVMQRLAQDAYELTPGGQWLNLAPDGRLNVPAPWSKHNHGRWRMRKQDAELLRLLMVGAQNAHAKGQAPVPWIYFAPERARWFVNLGDYPTMAHALAYVDRHLAAVWSWETLVSASEALQRRSPVGRKRVRGEGAQRAPGEGAKRGHTGAQG